jgi:5-methylcytosine-specific restriction protein B
MNPTELDEDTAVRRPLLLKIMFDVLLEASEPLPVSTVLDRVATRVELTARELSLNASGSPRWETYLRFASGWASKIGWISKRGGWSITEAGLAGVQGLGRDELYREITKRYRVTYNSEKKRLPRDPDPRTARVLDALALVTAGSWTSFGDLAEVVGVSPNYVSEAVYKESEAPTGYRVLRADGQPSTYFQWRDGRGADIRDVLGKEGVELDEQGRASPSQRLTAEDLRELMADLNTTAPTQRAWLVRGSSVNGHDLVPTWLSKGSISLAGSHLREVEPGISRDELKPIIEQDYAHLSYAARSEKLDEVHAFLSNMQVGDLVATTSQGRLYLGEITGEPTYQRSSDDRSNLRRTVSWTGPQAGLDYSELPSEITARLKTQRDIIDLTLQVDLLRPYLDQVPAESDMAKAPPPQVILPDATDELAERLHVNHAWLQEVIALLNDRPQLIFYGPPGTGKTYLAQEIAQHVAGDSYRLVQFHPAYSYEDFFEGYRPVSKADGSVGFELKGGPLRTLVDQAIENPTVPHLLIIDEINRGNLAKIFGELYFLLEYRDRSIDLLYASGSDKDFTLPKNVYVIGTMNTADRSIALVDAAMRRRFAFVPLHPSEEPIRSLLPSWLTSKGHDLRAADLLDELNSRIEDSDFKIGPSYFMRDAVFQPGGLERMWRTAILPLLEEHHYGDSINVPQRYGLNAVSTAVDARNEATTYAEDAARVDATP